MVIYMKHPIHGTKVSVAETEAVADEANGWVRFEVDNVKIFGERKQRKPKLAAVEMPDLFSEELNQEVA